LLIYHYSYSIVIIVTVCQAINWSNSRLKLLFELFIFKIGYNSAMTVKTNVKTQQEIGKNLREIRERRGLSQDELAKAAGISSSYTARIERGEENPTVTVIENICKALKIKSSDILPF